MKNKSIDDESIVRDFKICLRIDDILTNYTRIIKQYEQCLIEEDIDEADAFVYSSGIDKMNIFIQQLTQIKEYLLPVNKHQKEISWKKL
jgi:hypothetical protein